jgi:DNA-binding SARP family transcriptional activator
LLSRLLGLQTGEAGARLAPLQQVGSHAQPKITPATLPPASRVQGRPVCLMVDLTTLLELICLGPPTARLGGKDPPSDVLWRKHLGLLIYLALSPDRSRTRDHLLGVFWPEKPEKDARHSLNEAVRRLRSGLGTARLLTRGELITLQDDGLSVDVEQFAKLAERQRPDAAQLLRGDFLEGFSVDDAPDFEDWAARERTRWRAKGAAALVALGDGALALGHLDDAEEFALRALALESHSEPAVRLRLRAMALRGDTAGALISFHEFETRLAAEAGERPSPDLEALVKQIRLRRSRQPAVPHEDAPAPLVGDAEVRRRVFRVVSETLAGASRTLAIVAGPGLGKTRLLFECLNRAELEGALVVVSTPLESDHDAPWSTLRGLGRAGLATAPGSAATDPAALGVLATVAFDLPGPAPRVPADRGEVAAALTHLLCAVAEEQPLILAVDDAHFADGATLEALGAALAGVRHGPLALFVSCLPEAERGPAALTQLRSQIGGRLPGDTVRLAALEASDIRQLVDALAPWCPDEERRERLTRRVAFESGGIPFLAVTLLQALQRASTMRGDVLAWPAPGRTIDSPLPISVPDLVRMAVVARVSALDPQDLNLIRAASVGGRSFDRELLAGMCGLSPEALEEALARIERAGLATFDGFRYAFAAPLIAEVVRRECLTPGQRSTLLRRAAAALATRDDMDARVLRVEMLAEAAPGPEVVDLAVSAAEEALAAGAVRSARRALAAAECVVHAGAADRGRAARVAELRRWAEG